MWGTPVTEWGAKYWPSAGFQICSNKEAYFWWEHVQTAPPPLTPSLWPALRPDRHFHFDEGTRCIKHETLEMEYELRGSLTCSHQSDVWGRLIRGKGDPRGNGRRLGEVEGRGERLWNDLWTASFCCFITVQMKKCRILGEKSSNDKITDQWFRRRKANNTFKMRSNADGLEYVQWKELSPMHILIQYLYSRWLKSR